MQDRLSAVRPLAENEQAFLDLLLEHGEIAPTLPTDDEDLKKRSASHPGLQWKAVNVREHEVGSSIDDRWRAWRAVVSPCSCGTEDPPRLLVIN